MARLIFGVLIWPKTTRSKASLQNRRPAARIKTAAQVAVTAPAVGLLLSASTKSAQAQVAYDTTAHAHDFGINSTDASGDNDDVYTDADSGS